MTKVGVEELKERGRGWGEGLFLDGKFRRGTKSETKI